MPTRPRPPSSGRTTGRRCAALGRYRLDIVENARLFAIENLAADDAAIGCWESKYHWNSWRPITAIREAASDGNPATVADPAWTPLFDPRTTQAGSPLVTPPFPDHPAGHGCISGAIVRTLRRYFGTDKVAFSAFSTRTRTTRSYDRFSAALQEISTRACRAASHFRAADVQGAALGTRVAHWLAKHYFQPLRPRSGLKRRAPGASAAQRPGRTNRRAESPASDSPQTSAGAHGPRRRR